MDRLFPTVETVGYCQTSLRDYAVWLFLWGKRALGLLSLKLRSEVWNGLNTLLRAILQIGGLRPTVILHRDLS